MKEKVLKIVCLLCLFVPRVSVAQIFTHSSSPYSAQMPSVSMRSTSSMRTRTTTTAVRTGSSYGYGARSNNKASASGFKQATKMQGFYTAASNVYGGVTAAQMQAPARTSGPRRVGEYMPPAPDPEDEDLWDCDQCFDTNGDHLCDRCGCDLSSAEGCTCADESGYCWCPVGDGVDVWAMMAMMAIAYGIYGVWKGKNELPEC